MSITNTTNESVINSVLDRINSVNQNNRRIRYQKIDDFININTSFTNLNDLFLKAGFNVNTPEDFKNVPRDEIDTFVKNNTEFQSLTSLQKAALGIK